MSNNVVLLTGGAGFIGSHVLEGYVKNGFSVVVVDNLSTGDLGNIKHLLNENVVFCNVDIRDRERLEEVFKKYKPTIVNHHAAQKSVPYSVENPMYDISVNIVGTMNLIQLAGEYGVRSFVSVSSGGALSKEIIGDQKSCEGDMSQLVSPYAIAKFSNEKYLAIYAQKYGMEYSVLRYANVFGPRQIADGECGVIPIFVNNIMANKKSILMTYPDMPDGCTRDYVYISDVVRANMMVSQKPINDVVNIASGIELPIKDIYTAIVEVFDVEYNLEVVGPREGDVRRSVLDNSKAKRLIDWEPQVSLKEGLVNLRKYMKV